MTKESGLKDVIYLYLSNDIELCLESLDDFAFFHRGGRLCLQNDLPNVFTGYKVVYCQV